MPRLTTTKYNGGSKNEREKANKEKGREGTRETEREREGGEGKYPRTNTQRKLQQQKSIQERLTTSTPPQKEKTERRKRDLHKQNKHLSKARERVPPSTKTHTHTQKGPTEMAHCVWRGEVGGAE